MNNSLANRFRLALAKRAQRKAVAAYRKTGGLAGLLAVANADRRVANAYNRIQPIAGCTYGM